MNKLNCNEEGKNGILEKFIPAVSKGTSRNSVRGGGVSIVKAKTAMRMSINKSLLDILRITDKVQVSYSDDAIAIAKELPGNDNYFNVKISNNKGNIYSAGLVSEITELYDLDFTDKVSITFNQIQYESIQGIDVAIVTIKQ